LISQAAEGKARAAAVDDWVGERLAGTYVRLSPEHNRCPFEHDWAKTGPNH
jgi:hypothetical protein